jgi:hypothetical protein
LFLGTGRSRFTKHFRSLGANFGFLICEQWKQWFQSGHLGSTDLAESPNGVKAREEMSTFGCHLG